MSASPGTVRLTQNIRSSHEDRGSYTGVPVEQLIRDAHQVLSAAGVTMSPSKVSRTVREYVRLSEAGTTKYDFLGFLAARLVADRDSLRRAATAPGLRYLTEYADPTGETAVRNIEGGGRVA